MATNIINVKAQGYTQENAYQFRITANATGNISGNTREVEAYLDAYATNPGGYESFSSPRAYIFVAGAQKTVATIGSIWPRGQWIRLAYWKGYVTANQTVKITGRYNPNISGYSYMPLNQNSDVSVNLTLAGVASKITAADSSFDAFLVTYTKYVSTYYEKLNIYVTASGVKTLIKSIDGYTSGTVVEYTEEETNSIYNAMANVNSATITYELVTYSSSAMTTQIGSSVMTGTLKITNANPIFTDYTYSDINATTLALTGNDQTIILGHSTLQVVVSEENKAVAQKGATMKNYTFNQSTSQYNETVIMTIGKYNSETINVSAIDSRGNSTTVIKQLEAIKYSAPTANTESATLVRQNNTGTQVTANISGTWFNQNFGAADNELSATYRYKIAGSSTWTYGTIDNLTIDGNNYSYSGAIKGDAEDNGFLVENSYDIEIFINDSLTQDTVKFTFQLIAGEPAIKIKGNKVIEINGEKPVFGSETYYETHDFTVVSGTLAASGWRQMAEYVTTSILPKGKYLFIMAASITGTGTGMGVATFNPSMDGTRLTQNTRQTIPTSSNLTVTGICTFFREFTEETTHVLNCYVYPSLVVTPVMVRVNIIKISD